MRVNSITSYTQGAFEPKSTSQNQNQNGHAVNFGNLTKPFDVFKKEILAIPGFEEGLKKIHINFDSCLDFFQRQEDILVDIKNGVIQIQIIGESEFARMCERFRYLDEDIFDYKNITKPKDFIDIASGAIYVRQAVDKPPKPPEMVYKVESFADLNALAADLHY